MTRMIVLLTAVGMLTACAYLESVNKQNELIENQKTNPAQRNEKHLLTRQSYFVYGQLKMTGEYKRKHSLAVVALSDKYQQNEVVDINHRSKMDSYYGLTLPAGTYQLVVVEDRNGDNIYRENEIIAQQQITLDAATYPDMVVGNVNIQLPQADVSFNHKLVIPVSTAHNTPRSLYYPKGTIRSLDDPIFSERAATLGMYDPAAFMESAPMMFYALEEDTPHKVPVIFVHGIGGSAKEFEDIINKLDRTRYKPWFYHYPSGMDLNQLAKLFYDIYLSGKVIGKNPSQTVIVAHSMGGLVVREAFNMYQGNDEEIQVKLFVSLASPFGGMASAQTGVENAPLVLPAWRNLTPTGTFISKLFRQPLPANTEHHVMYAYLNAGDRNDADGVVPVHGQLPQAVTASSSAQHGFKTGHAQILHDPVAIDALLGLIGRVKSYFPEEHVRYWNMGGFDVELGSTYNDIEKRAIQVFGIYFRAVANGEIKPIPLNKHFLDAVQGKTGSVDDADTAWLKFQKDYPELAAGSQ